MASVGVARYVEMLAERGLRAFRWPGSTAHILGEAPPLRWRVSKDERERVLQVAGIHGVAEVAIEDITVPVEYMLGLRYVVDADLPPNSVILEDLP